VVERKIQLELKDTFYIHTLEGEAFLVEISEFNGGISIMVGEKRVDLDPESAVELADSLISMAAEILDG